MEKIDRIKIKKMDYANMLVVNEYQIEIKFIRDIYYHDHIVKIRYQLLPDMLDYLEFEYSKENAKEVEQVVNETLDYLEGRNL